MRCSLAQRAAGGRRDRRYGWTPLRFFLPVVGIIVGLLWGSPARAETVHVIRAGDSLAGIARQYGVDADALAAYNNIADPNLIVIGQQLVIPPPASSPSQAVPAGDSPLPGQEGYHTVERGESLSAIARQYDLALSDLLRLNGLADANMIWVGQKLRLSARVAPAAPAQKAKPVAAETIHLVAPGETLALIAQQYGTTVERLMRSNGLPNSGFVYTGQRLRVPPNSTSADNIFGVAGAPADGRRWIEVDLSDQTLIAWQGDLAVLRTTVSTGKAATPTVVGKFAIQTKYDSQHMTGDDYDLPGVPWVMYFFEDYAIHGAYWHANFGTPTSHGCINMRISEAKALYQWADIGTEVVVHE
ncbi:MAG TPA: LysM peptidoglycan-binding domain-containing protein [Caldilineaceae bacterium]|nr:LysM peptidoglycan-binding domain-containing protein [Caldilineaceae bacterium]